MSGFTNYVLHSADFRKTFDGLLRSLHTNPRYTQFLVDAETTGFRFFRTLAHDESGQHAPTSEHASFEGEQILMLLSRLYSILEENAENHRLIILLAVSTGTWIADRQGEIRELELIVSGIATFANQSSNRQELEELYEISLKIIHAANDFVKADLDKRDPQRPWRLLCLNHCIIATRTDNGDLARLAYDRLINYLPEEAKDFFKMGMQKISEGQYSVHSRNIMKAYYEMFSSDRYSQCTTDRSLN